MSLSVAQFLHYRTYPSRKEEVNKDILPSLAVDSAEITAYGGIPMGSNALNDLSPDELIGAGHHFRDVARSQYRESRSKQKTPRDYLINQVEALGLKRPTPKQWKEL